MRCAAAGCRSKVGRQTDDRTPFYTMRFVRGLALAEAAASFHERKPLVNLVSFLSCKLQIRECFPANTQVHVANGHVPQCRGNGNIVCASEAPMRVTVHCSSTVGTEKPVTPFDNGCIVRSECRLFTSQRQTIIFARISGNPAVIIHVGQPARGLGAW
jgi:hypothetical protein